MTLFAVHISDGVLTWPWLAGGFVVAAALLALSAWRLRDDEIPRIAILTAAFFVSSAIHIKIPGTSIHLLLVGLVGVVLGFRAALAIFIGLVLQLFLLEHGGRWTLGINTCVMTLPALFSFLLFRGLHRLAWIKTSIGRALLVGVGAAILFMSGVYSLTLVANTSITEFDDSAIAVANARLIDPWALLGALLFTIAAIAIERRLENTPEFPLGFLIGELSVLLTVALNCIVLLAGGEQTWPMPPLLLVIAHLPFAVVEGMILGFVVGFLAKVKPEMLGILNHGGHGDHGEMRKSVIAETK
jgi:ABC-type Co2+ transport system permease subunit